MYCRSCGNKLEDNDKFCGKCGTPKLVTNNVQSNYVANSVVQPAESNTDKAIFGVIGFISPIVGFILSLFAKKDKPESAKIGIIVSIISFVLRFLYFIFWFVFGILQAI